MNSKPGIIPGIAIVKAYTLIAAIYCASFSLIFYYVAENTFLTEVHLAALISVTVNYTVLQFTGNLKRANTIILTTGTGVVLALFATGGWEGTGYLWPFAYLPFAFFLSDPKSMLRWIILLLTGCLLLVLLDVMDVITIPYSATALFNYFAALLIFIVCIHLFQVATIRYQEFLSNSKTAELQKSEHKFRSLVEQASDGIFISDASGKFTDVNSSACKLLGYTREELLTLAITDLLTEEELTRRPMQFDELRTGKPVISERRLKRKDGAFVDTEISSRILPDGDFQGIVRDITERKKTAEALVQLNETLEHKVADRTRLLEQANNELEAFSYSVSHDLRAPLRAIHGYAKMLEDDSMDQLDQNGKRMLGIVQENARKMGLLIDDLLAFSKLGRKEVQKSTIDMTALTESVVAEMSRNTQHHAEIRIGTLHPTMADSALLKQVMVNLLSNAVKYSSKVEKPVVEIESVITDGEIVYSVRDNGTGFDMHYAHKLFGVFQRLHTSAEFEGTGVGLAIVKRIISKHGGQVRAEGVPGKGATFYFSLPVH